MNRSGSHSNDENLVNTGYWEGPRIRASVRHGGASSFSGKTRSWSRRGSAPAGAAAPIVMGVWGHQPPSCVF